MDFVSGSVTKLTTDRLPRPGPGQPTQRAQRGQRQPAMTRQPTVEIPTNFLIRQYQNEVIVGFLGWFERGLALLVSISGRKKGNIAQQEKRKKKRKSFSKLMAANAEGGGGSSRTHRWNQKKKNVPATQVRGTNMKLNLGQKSKVSSYLYFSRPKVVDSCPAVTSRWGLLAPTGVGRVPLRPTWGVGGGFIHAPMADELTPECHGAPTPARLPRPHGESFPTTAAGLEQFIGERAPYATFGVPPTTKQPGRRDATDSWPAPAPGGGMLAVALNLTHFPVPLEREAGRVGGRPCDRGSVCTTRARWWVRNDIGSRRIMPSLLALLPRRWATPPTSPRSRIQALTRVAVRVRIVVPLRRRGGPRSSAKNAADPARPCEG